MGKNEYQMNTRSRNNYTALKKMSGRLDEVLKKMVSQALLL